MKVPYNLIDECWIPVERRSGRIDWIAPSGIADANDPPLRVASARPDFDGALLEFIVGLVQTAAAPATEREWERLYEAPPSPGDLAKRFGKVREAFNLDGDGPRFMQDLTVDGEEALRTVPIGALLIDRIGEEGLSESPSLFAKPGGFDALGYPSAAAALMALQTYAPPGGRGQLTSLRGGGPLTTLIAGATLWETAWLNVLPSKVFVEHVPGDPEREGLAAIFPWMAKTRVSSAKGGKPTPPKAIHPLQHLWGLPRRFRLIVEPDARGTCGVTGRPGVPVVRAYVSRPDGTSYEGDFRHPWSPHGFVEAGAPWNPKKGSADGLPYRDWPQLVTGTTERRPATVVTQFGHLRRNELVASTRLLAFGYAMDKKRMMTPLRWCRAETPLISVPLDQTDAFAAAVEALVAASEEVRKELSSQLKAAWSDRPKDEKALERVPDRVNPAFWSATEGGFFEAVHALKRALEARDALAAEAAKEAWLVALHRDALRLFDSFVDASASLAPPDLRRAVTARRNLVLFSAPAAKKLRKVLGLLVDEPEERKPRAGRRGGRKEKTT